MGEKILIVGSGAAADKLKDKLNEQGAEVFTSGGIDVRENKPGQLLEFAVNDGINLTAVFSVAAIKSDIADIFQSNGQLIFAPPLYSAGLLSRSECKRILYKEHIPVPQFVIFEKQQFAADYLTTAKYPLIVSGEDDGQLLCTTFSQAQKFTDYLAGRNTPKFIIEDYVYGHAFTFYFITDGYHALPVAAVGKDGGGREYAPDYKTPDELEDYIMRCIVPRVFYGQAGAWGIECVLADEPVVVGIKSEIPPLLLDIIDEDIYRLFEACAAGSFADNYNYIKMSGNSAVAFAGETAIGRTLSRAWQNLCEKLPDLSLNDFSLSE